MRQYELSEGTTRIICWLDAHLTPGQQLTLKETGDLLWTVDHAYGTQVAKPTLYKPWRVGGLR